MLLGDACLLIAGNSSSFGLGGASLLLLWLVMLFVLANCFGTGFTLSGSTTSDFVPSNALFVVSTESRGRLRGGMTTRGRDSGGTIGGIIMVGASFLSVLSVLSDRSTLSGFSLALSGSFGLSTSITLSTLSGSLLVLSTCFVLSALSTSSSLSVLSFFLSTLILFAVGGSPEGVRGEFEAKARRFCIEEL